jgi:tetratricopeptide (TPR) repeat protein
VVDNPEWTATLAHAIELIAAGELAQALPMLETCDPAHPDVAAATAAIHLAQGRPADALAPLDRALAAEPDWPLHHWNLAVALHQLGDGPACYHALRRFVTASAQRTGLFADPDQVARVGCAERLIAELERTARLTGAALSTSSATSSRARTSP